jgi:hypothetical protein
MQVVFLARGPAFSQNIQIRSINNVDIYHIACHILELIPNPYMPMLVRFKISLIFFDQQLIIHPHFRLITVLCYSSNSGHIAIISLFFYFLEILLNAMIPLNEI